MAIDTLERIRLGDTSAFEGLVEECWGPLVQYLTTILGSRDRAQDLAQEALIRLWERRDRWSPGPARGLLFRIGRNLAFDSLDQDRVRFRWARREVDSPPSPPPTPAEEVEASEAREKVRESLAALPRRRREVVELIRFRGLSYAEAGDVLGISVQTVANHLSLAFRDLRPLLARHLEEGHPEPGTSQRGRSSDG